MQTAQNIRNFNEIQTKGPQRICQPASVLRKITPKMTIGDGDTQVYFCKFDGEDNYLACGYGDGMTRIYSTDTGKLAFTLADMNVTSTMPVTSLQWRPNSSSMKTSNILVTATADGTLRHWHVSSGKLLHQIQPDPENHIYTMDFNADGTMLAVAGRDKHVHVYDETTKQLAFKMKEGYEQVGHSNRIFCAKFNKVDSNMIVSGGWDNTIQIYDLRYRSTVNSIYGPHICGDCIEIRNDGYTMMTGSYRMDDVIEIWDLRMNKRTRTIPWEGTGAEEDMFYEEATTDRSSTNEENKSNRSDSVLGSITNNSFNQTSNSMNGTGKGLVKKVHKPENEIAPFLYSACFNQKQDLLFCGGAGKNEMRVFDWQSGAIVGMVGNIPKSILCGDTGKSSNVFAFGAADSKARIFGITSQKGKK